MVKSNLIQDRSFQFAVNIVKFSNQLKDRRQYVLSNQLLKSGTSIGANIEEAIGGASRHDFLSKLIIANKEARETKYWLRLIDATSTIKCEKWIHEADQLIKILSRIIISTKHNNERE